MLTNVKPTSTLVHATISGITGGTATLKIYNNAIGGSCGLATCTSGSSCSVLVPCGASGSYYAEVIGSNGGCSPLTFKLTATSGGMNFRLLL